MFLNWLLGRSINSSSWIVHIFCTICCFPFFSPSATEVLKGSPLWWLFCIYVGAFAEMSSLTFCLHGVLQNHPKHFMNKVVCASKRLAANCSCASQWAYLLRQTHAFHKYSWDIFKKKTKPLTSDWIKAPSVTFKTGQYIFLNCQRRPINTGTTFSFVTAKPRLNIIFLNTFDNWLNDIFFFFS